MSLKEAIKLPILIHWRTKYYISSNAKIYYKSGGVKIGINKGSYGLTSGRTTFCVYDDSVVYFDDDCNISRGTTVFVRFGAQLRFGSHFFCNANCRILANKSISFGNDTLMGWNITILDSDGHPTFYNGDRQLIAKPIVINDHCWIGAEASILKGVILCPNTIIPYGALVFKDNTMPNSVFSNKVLKQNIEWKEF